MAQEPYPFYKAEKARFEAALHKSKSRLKTISTLRFVVFLSTVFCLYYFLGNTNLMLSIGGIGSIVFLVLLKIYFKLKSEYEQLATLLDINKVEIDVLEGNYGHLSSGKEYLEPSHAYSFDIDLFGSHSFFQYTNRTGTKAGEGLYAKLLKENNIFDIENKQEALKELSEKPSWRQRFLAIASLIKTERSPEEIVKWLDIYALSFPKMMAVITKLFSVISLAIITAVSLGYLRFSYLLVWYFLGLGISGIYFAKVSKLYNGASKAKATFLQYYKLLGHLETTSFTSEILQSKHAEISSDGHSVAKILREFFKYLDALDQRNNIVFAFLGNGLLLWDIQQAVKIESWMEKYGNEVERWFDVVAFFDAEITLANFVFNHPKFAFPAIVKNGTVLDAKQLGHPLLSETKRVCSDCSIGSQEFFIVTGANMAGKSTFLRTISLNIVMANMGLPVCAEQFDYQPVKLITSMRTSDSLADDSSYFFSELTRLKYIVDSLETDHYFIVLDEILKGTNSTDKAVGSQKFVEKLVKSNATGIIATHDLSLCEIEKDYSQIRNYFFDAQVINDSLYFDYTLQKGICQNRNASFLLKKMEII